MKLSQIIRFIFFAVLLAPCIAFAQGGVSTPVISSVEPLPNCAAPAAPLPAYIIYDLTAGLLKYCSGTNTWSNVGGPPFGAAGGDLGSTYPNPTVVATHLASPLPVAQGGTGLATQTTNVVYKGNGTSAEQVTSITDNGTTVALTEPLSTTGAVSTGTGCTPAASTATGGFCGTESTSTGWTPTAGFDYCRADSTIHSFLCSINGGAEVPGILNISTITAANTRWYGFTVFSPPPLGTSGGTGVLVANNPALFLFYLPIVAKVTNASVFVATGSGATTADVGMYSSTGTLLWHTGSFATTGTNSTLTNAVSGGAVTLQPGLYYEAFCDSSATPTFMPMTSSGSNMRSFLESPVAAHTYGTDTAVGDNCTAGVLPASITITNIVNSTSVDVPALIMTN